MKNNKFRVWSTQEKRWFDPRICYLDGYNDLFIMYDGKLIRASSTRFKVNQYTGLNDKNNKEIYEGDIVKRFNDTTVLRFGFYTDFTNDYCKTSYGFYMKDSYEMEYSFIDEFYMIEVIGNIYETPELLKG